MPNIKGRFIKKKIEPQLDLNQGVESIIKAVDSLRNTQNAVVERVDTKLEEVDQVVEQIGLKIEEIKDIKKGEDGKDADPYEVAQIVLDNIELPKNGKDADEEIIVEKVLGKIPKIDEKKLKKEILSLVPKADLKIIQENIEIDPMSVIDKIMALPVEKRRKLQLDTDNISGFQQTLNAFRNQLGRGYIHGGGISDITGLIQEGSNITITGSGTKTSPYVINGTSNVSTLAQVSSVSTDATKSLYTMTSSVPVEFKLGSSSFLKLDADNSIIKLNGVKPTFRFTYASGVNTFDIFADGNTSLNFKRNSTTMLQLDYLGKMNVNAPIIGTTALTSASGTGYGNIFTTNHTINTSASYEGTSFNSNVTVSSANSSNIIGNHSTVTNNSSSNINSMSLTGYQLDLNHSGGSGTLAGITGMNVQGFVSNTATVSNVYGVKFNGLFTPSSGAVTTQYGYYYDQLYITPGTGYAFYSKVNPSGGTLASLTDISIIPGSGKLIKLFGQTSSFPAFKRNSATLEIRLADDSAYADITSNKVIANNIIRLKGYTVATLPAGTTGDTAYVTDALAPSFLATVVGGGAVVTPVFYNGSNWVGY